mmetsp:Transcript_44742/g.83575  ORF Transcript_44742/g.83575 Transcript_44742/m.83575 type:complete len:235 (-) Transcript_44742:176-880(-)
MVSEKKITESSQFSLALILGCEGIPPEGPAVVVRRTGHWALLHLKHSSLQRPALYLFWTRADVQGRPTWSGLVVPPMSGVQHTPLAQQRRSLPDHAHGFLAMEDVHEQGSIPALRVEAIARSHHVAQLHFHVFQSSRSQPFLAVAHHAGVHVKRPQTAGPPRHWQREGPVAAAELHNMIMEALMKAKGLQRLLRMQQRLPVIHWWHPTLSHAGRRKICLGTDCLSAAGWAARAR